MTRLTAMRCRTRFAGDADRRFARAVRALAVASAVVATSLRRGIQKPVLARRYRSCNCCMAACTGQDGMPNPSDPLPTSLLAEFSGTKARTSVIRIS